MKNLNNFKILLLFIIGIFLINNILAQDTLDVAPLNDEGEFNLVPTIWGDTIDGGARKNLNRVYRLQRGGIYVMDQTIYANYPIRFVADNKDKSKRPPILIRGSYSTGANIKTFFTFSKDGLSHSFKGIIFNGVDLDNNYFNEWNRGLKIAGNDISLTIEDCIMNAWAGLFLEVTGDDASIFIRDSKWRNGVSAQAPPWGAQQNVVFSLHVDTIIMTNNTAFNTGGFLMDFEKGAVANYILVEHNTFYTGLIDMLRMRDMSNAKFRSNLYYCTHAYGQAESERKSNWFDRDQEYLSMFSIDTTDVNLLNSIGLTEADKDIVVSNNTYFSPQVLKDWWASVSGLNTPVWMNARTKAMFDDDSSYPQLNAFNNTETNPNFVDTDMDTWVVGEVVEYCKNVRAHSAITDRNYDRHTGLTNLRMLPWPLPESLVYSNADMLVGGHDGLPVGDLNWYPDKRALYKENGVNALDITRKNPVVSSFPNPVKDIVEFDFTILSKSDVSLELFNINGEKVLSLINRNLLPGDYKKKYDLNNLDKGIYFYKLRIGNQAQTKKLIIL